LCVGEPCQIKRQQRSMLADVWHSCLLGSNLISDATKTTVKQLTRAFSLTQITSAVNGQLDLLFPVEKYSHVRIIAEPGRYYAASAFTLTTNVIAKKKVVAELSDGIPANGGFSSEIESLFQTSAGSYSFIVLTF